MTLVRSILKGIADERALDAHVTVASPVRDLVEQYNKIAFHDDNLPKITALCTGSQLKNAIDLLEPEDQVALLHKYSLAIKSPDQPDEYRNDPDKEQLRKMRMTLFTIAVAIVCISFFVMIGVTLTVAIKSGNLPNEGVWKSMISGAWEVIKFISSTPSK